MINGINIRAKNAAIGDGHSQGINQHHATIVSKIQVVSVFWAKFIKLDVGSTAALYISPFSSKKLFKGKNKIEKIMKFNMKSENVSFRSDQVLWAQLRSKPPHEISHKSKNAYFIYSTSKKKPDTK